jgi:hypothetical protein
MPNGASTETRNEPKGGQRMELPPQPGAGPDNTGNHNEHHDDERRPDETSTERQLELPFDIRLDGGTARQPSANTDDDTGSPSELLVQLRSTTKPHAPARGDRLSGHCPRPTGRGRPRDIHD